MAKNPNKRTRAAKKDEPMTQMMKLFLAGCGAELYLLIVRRFYYQGNAEQQIAWYDQYLPFLIGLGIVVLALGLISRYVLRGKWISRSASWYIAGAGAFLALANGIILWNISTVTLLTVVVPVAMLLGVLWCLYDRTCALSLTVLGITLVALWVCQRELSNIFIGSYIRAAAAIYCVLMVALAAVVKWGKSKFLLPVRSDPLAVYVACGLSLVAMVASLVYTPAAYYAMWALAIVVFALAVYYTVKQL